MKQISKVFIAVMLAVVMLAGVAVVGFIAMIPGLNIILLILAAILLIAVVAGYLANKLVK